MYSPPKTGAGKQKFFEIKPDRNGCPVLYYKGRPAPIGQRLCVLPDGTRFGAWGMASTNPVCRAAIDYAHKGIPVFPCNPENKQPHVKGGFKAATTDPEKISAWWKRWPNALIGMPTGKASGIAVLDLDVKNGKNGLEVVSNWRTRSNVIVQTRSGGVHLYFANDDAVKSQSDKIAPGVDTRGNGGYVIIPPSEGYSFIAGDLSDRSVLLKWPADVRPRERNADEHGAEEPPPPRGEQSRITDFERSRIEAALNVIPSNDYHIWFEVGAALFHALGEDGFVLFDKWSAKSPKYSKEKCAQQWRHCGGVEKITLGTIFHYANEANADWQKEFEAKRGKPLILSSRDFVEGFIPPDYLLDGVLQRGFLYSVTAPTGTGKTAIVLRIAAHVSTGLPLASREVVQGKVLYFAGENPDDIRTRWIKLCEEMEIVPSVADVFFVAGTIVISKLRNRIDAEARVHGPFALIVVDTLAAYFEGEEENSNTQMGKNARMLRSLANVEGGPTVMVTCHPTKSPNLDNLLPRGGGAFLAEVDGNLVCLKHDGGVVDLHWQGKFRGADFPAIPFKIEPGTSPSLKDRRGRSIWTVTARPLSGGEREAVEGESRQRQTRVLAVMQSHPNLSLAEWATMLGWFYQSGGPNKGLIKRAIDELEKRGLTKKGDGNNWTLTAAGKKFRTGDDEPM